MDAKTEERKRTSLELIKHINLAGTKVSRYLLDNNIQVDTSLCSDNERAEMLLNHVSECEKAVGDFSKSLDEKNFENCTEGQLDSLVKVFFEIIQTQMLFKDQTNPEDALSIQTIILGFEEINRAIAKVELCQQSSQEQE